MSFLLPHPVLWETPLGPVTAHSLAFAMAALIASLLFAWQLKRRAGRSFVDTVEDAVVIFLSGLFGARIGYLLTYREEWESLVQLFTIWEGGLVSFWGIAAGLGAATWRARRLPQEQRPIWWREMTLAALLGWAIGRLGNYYMAESGGVASEFWVATYGQVPVQLFEAAWVVVLWVVLRKAKIPAAFVPWLAVLFYLAGRFLIDFWRDEAIWAGLRNSQWAALILFILTILIMRRYGPTLRR
jgi:prolipoprotein diacylglyceryltransferase